MLSAVPPSQCLYSSPMFWLQLSMFQISSKECLLYAVFLCHFFPITSAVAFAMGSGCCTTPPGSVAANQWFSLKLIAATLFPSVHLKHASVCPTLHMWMSQEYICFFPLQIRGRLHSQNTSETWFLSYRLVFPNGKTTNDGVTNIFV